MGWRGPDGVAGPVGRVVEAVEARGKHLLVRFDDGRTLHTHLRMEGSWHIYRPGEAWRKPSWRARAVIETGEWVAVCFDASICEVLAAGHEPALVRRLGPDLLADDPDLEEVIRRTREHPGLTIGEALMRQHIVSGIGNVYKSETLFLTRVSPLARIEDLSNETLHAVLSEARRLMARNLGGSPRVTRRRFGRDRFWVYGRSGQRCFECGHLICVTRQGEDARSTYHCPQCQPSPLGRG